MSTSWSRKRTRARQKVMPGFPWEGKFRTKEAIDAYFAGEKIQCLLCGKWYTWLSHNHLGQIHQTTGDEYRARYGLPWERGLTGKCLHKTFVRHGKELAAERPELQEFLKDIRQKARKTPQRPCQPFQIDLHVRQALLMTGRTGQWQLADFEAILTRIQDQQRALDDVCQDADLPSKRMWFSFTRKHPQLRKRLRQIYHSWPYAVQLRLCKRVSPQFRDDCLRLREQGLNSSEIAKNLGVSQNSVRVAVRGAHKLTPAWQPADFEAILTRIREQQRSLNDVCRDPDLPAKSAWQKFVKAHPEFSERVRQIYHSWPYAAQIRLRIEVSPQFRDDCLRLRDQGLTRAEIAKVLDVPLNSVRWALRGLHDRFRKWQYADFEKLLLRMQEQQRNLYDLFNDPDLPNRAAWYRFVTKHPEFAERVRQIYASWPYTVLARFHEKFPPQFQRDCQRLHAQGLNFSEIAKTLGVTQSTVSRTFRKAK